MSYCRSCTFKAGLPHRLAFLPVSVVKIHGALSEHSRTRKWMKVNRFFLFLEEFQRLSMLQRDLSHQYFEIFRIFWVQFHSFWYTFIDFNYFPSKGINVKAKPVETELKPNRNPSSKPNCFARCFTDQVTPSRFAWSHSCRGTTWNTATMLDIEKRTTKLRRPSLISPISCRKKCWWCVISKGLEPSTQIHRFIPPMEKDLVLAIWVLKGFDASFGLIDITCFVKN